MTDKQDIALNKLLDLALPVPNSNDLKQDILASALLSSAHKPPYSPDLKDKILAAATKKDSAEIIAFRPRRKSFGLTIPAFENIAAAGLIAASLILGIWSGSNGIADAFISAPLELAGLQSPDSDIFSFYNIIDGLTPSESSL